MAKDPAFLFYPGDWQGGTSTFTRHMKGCYMDVLIAQFNSGPLSLEEIKTVLGSDFGSSWPTLQKKFSQKNGLFFNERLELEKLKRKEYSDSRRNNRYGKKPTYDKSHVKDMSNHMDNENRNEVRSKDDKGGMGGKEGIAIYKPEPFLKETQNSYWLEGLAVELGADPEWMNLKLEEFAKDQKNTNGFGRALGDLKTHFYRWVKIKIEQKSREKKTDGKIDKILSIDERQNQELAAKYGKQA